MPFVSRGTPCFEMLLRFIYGAVVFFANGTLPRKLMLFHRDRLCKIARFVWIIATLHCAVIGEELSRND